MNTLFSFLILVTSVIVSLFTIPIIVKRLGPSQNIGPVSIMFILAGTDLAFRIIDVRGTKLEADDRLVYPRCGGSFLLAPIWILALVMILLIVFGAYK